MTILEVLGVNKLETYIGSIITSIGLFLLAVKNPNIKYKLLEFIGGKLYTWIYILHVMIIWIIKDYEKKIELVNNKLCYVNVVIVFVITVIIAAIIYWIGILYKKIIRRYLINL